MQKNILELNKHEFLCAEGELQLDMFFLEQGELLVFTVNDKGIVTPLAYIPPGNFVGEQSFFDRLPRSANVMATEKSILVKIPEIDINKTLPKWLLKYCETLSSEIRSFDQVIKNHGIKKTKAVSESALAADQQKDIITKLNAYMKSKK